jgi:hypothetical protein
MLGYNPNILFSFLKWKGEKMEEQIIFYIRPKTELQNYHYLWNDKYSISLFCESIKEVNGGYEVRTKENNLIILFNNPHVKFTGAKRVIQKLNKEVKK